MVVAAAGGGGGAVAANGVDDAELAAPEESKERRVSAPWAYARSLAWVRPVLILAALYLLALSLILAIFSQLPSPSQLAERHATGGGEAGAAPERLALAVPHSFQELRSVRRTLELYRRNYAVHVAALMVATHIFLQTFMMPGSIFINVLAGSMYPLPVATCFAATVDCCGAAANYWLSRWLLRDVVAGFFPDRVHAFATEMKRHHANLLNYNLFIRTAPIFPSWVVNLASPIVGVPFRIFTLALLAGHLPINFISVKAGHNLATMQSVSDMYSSRNVLFLLAAGALALTPVALRRLRATDRVVAQRQGAAALQRHLHHAHQHAGGAGDAALGGASAGGSPSAALAAAGKHLPVISLGGMLPTSARPGGGGAGGLASGLASVVVVGAAGGKRPGAAPADPAAKLRAESANHIL